MEILALGSIVQVKNDYRDYIIIARGVITKVDGEDKFFDYGVVSYPDGIQNDQFNFITKEMIEQVVFNGYKDESNDEFEKKLHKYIVENWTKE
ncbi:MAG: DUF4176 domain-containing protein [Eubacterium sp.]